MTCNGTHTKGLVNTNAKLLTAQLPELFFFFPWQSKKPREIITTCRFQHISVMYLAVNLPVSKQLVQASYTRNWAAMYFPWQFSLKNYVLVATMWKPKEWRTAPSCLLLLPGYSDTYLSNYTYNYAVDVVYYAGCHFRMEADSPPQKKGRGKLKKPNKESIQN